MILKGLKHRFLQKKIEESLAKPKKFENLTATKVDSLLVFVDIHFDKKVLKNIIQKLNIDSSRVKIVSFTNKIDKNMKPEEGVFSPKDFNVFGAIATKELESIINTSYDLLINYRADSTYTNYLVTVAKADFKIGFSSVGEQLFDLSVQVDETDFSVYNNEIEKYLKILNKV